MSRKKASKPAPTIQDLYPELKGKQLEEAEEALTQYVLNAWQIYQRIVSDPVLHEQFKKHLADQKEAEKKKGKQKKK